MQSTISLNFNGTLDISSDIPRTIRDHKGKSLLIKPDKYIVIDIETTGFSYLFDSIIEIAAIKYIGHDKVDVFSSLIKPEEYPIDPFYEELTGITNEMLATAPSLSDVLPKFYDFIGNWTLIGHNVNFDINFLYDACLDILSKPLVNDYMDTLRVSRLINKDLKHHRLKDLCVFYHLDQKSMHRAESDCLIANEILNHLSSSILENHESWEAFAATKPKRVYHKASNIVATTSEFDESHPLFGKTCVFTGALSKMIRKDAMQIVANLGGINGDNITKETNYLILGNLDYSKNITDPEGKSGKLKKAEKLILKGADLQIIPEDIFYEMIVSE